MPQITEYPILHDQEARPSPPGPYCVFELSEGVRLHNSGAQPGDGLPSQGEHHVDSVQLEFRVHCKGNTRESGKAICVRLAIKVMQAFDDALFDIFPNRIITSTRDVDNGERISEDEYVWHIRYMLMTDELQPASVGVLHAGIRSHWIASNLDAPFLAER